MTVMRFLNSATAVIKTEAMDCGCANSSGLSVVHNLSFSVYDLQRIINESSVFCHTGDILREVSSECLKEEHI